MKLSLPVAIALLSFAIFTASAPAQDEPTTSPATTTLIEASDKDAIAAAMGEEVIIQGVIQLAEWSRSGKVMNIEFKDASESRLLAVAFERHRAALDGAFGGDVAKTLTGAKVRIKGVLAPYGGQSETWKGRPQIIITRGEQITIVEAAPQEPATAPTTQP